MTTRAFPSLLIGLLMAATAPRASADEYLNEFVDGDWTDGGTSETSTMPGVADSAWDLDSGMLRVFAGVPGMGEAEARAEIHLDFTYAHSHTWWNTIDLRYHLRGLTQYAGSGTADLTVQIELWDTSPGSPESLLKTITDVQVSSESWQTDEDRMVTFRQMLTPDSTYRVKLIAIAHSAGPGANLVDFRTEPVYDRLADLDYLGIYHTHSSVTLDVGETSGNPSSEETYCLVQDQFEAGADQLMFTSFNDYTDVHGWRVAIDHFPAAAGTPVGARELDVAASGEIILRDLTTTVKVGQWLNYSHLCNNHMDIKDVYWNEYAGRRGSLARALPNHAWRFDYPVEVPESPGTYRHTFTLTNRDPDWDLHVSALSFLATMDEQEEMQAIEFAGPVYTFTLPVSPPELTWSTDVLTDGPFLDGYIYFKYSLSNSTGSKVICNSWGAHLVTERPLTGDVNCDGTLNVFDIDPFVLALTDPDAYVADNPYCDWMLADVNCDGAINVFDIDPFVVGLTGGGCPPCP
jgi:hypothetical protein